MTRKDHEDHDQVQIDVHRRRETGQVRHPRGKCTPVLGQAMIFHSPARKGNWHANSLPNQGIRAFKCLPVEAWLGLTGNCSALRGWRACPSRSRQLGEDQKCWTGWRWHLNTRCANNIPSWEKQWAHERGATIRLSNVGLGGVGPGVTWRFVHTRFLVPVSMIWGRKGPLRCAFSVRAGPTAPPTEAAVGSPSTRSSNYVGRLG